MLSFKVILTSTTVVLAAILLKLSVPVLADFAVHEVPFIYNGLVSWIKPPFLYLVINCIIVTIIAFSKFQSRNDDVAPPAPVESIQTDYPATEYKYEDDAVLDDTRVLDFDKEDRWNQTTPFSSFLVDSTSNKENEFVVGKSSWNSIRKKDSTGKSPSVSARFGRRRNGCPEGGGFSGSAKTILGVSKSKKQDTLESTWKTITDGRRAIPLTRHLRKSETWERENHGQEKTPQNMKITKAETFNDRTILSPGSSSSGGSGKMQSLSQDELTQRVEAFIKKFNDDMRNQRQDSMSRYKKIVKVAHTSNNEFD